MYENVLEILLTDKLSVIDVCRSCGDGCCSGEYEPELCFFFLLTATIAINKATIAAKVTQNQLMHRNLHCLHFPTTVME